MNLEKITLEALGRHLQAWRSLQRVSLYDIFKKTGVRIESLQNIEQGKGQVSTLMTYQLCIHESGCNVAGIWNKVIYELNEAIEGLNTEFASELRQGDSYNEARGDLPHWIEQLFSALHLYCATRYVRIPEEPADSLVYFYYTREMFAVKRIDAIMEVAEEFYKENEQPISVNMRTRLFYHAIVYRSPFRPSYLKEVEDYKEIMDMLRGQNGPYTKEERQRIIDAYYGLFDETLSPFIRRIADFRLAEAMFYLYELDDPYANYLLIRNLKPNHLEK